MGKREQDTSMEQLLREALSARDRAPQSECFDADVLAAWADGALTGSERSFAEAHAARCARCQAMLASMARTAPEPAAVAPALSIRRWITFLTPLAAGAVALALWFLVEPRSSIVPQQQPSSPSPTASTAAPPSPTSSVSGGVVPTERAAENERKEADRTQDARSADALRRRDADTAKKGRVADAPTANAAPAPTAKPVESPPADPAAFAKVVPEPKRNPEVPPPNPLDEQRLRQPASTPPAPSGRAAGARSAQSADQQVAQSDVKQRQGYLDAVGRQEAGRGAGAGQFRSTVAVPTIAVPGSNVRWRITVGRIIEHSLDGGTTWATQYSVPENTMLVAGVAPSSTVAWIVGTAGTVLQTSDGRTWRRVPFAAAVDLISVNASDARTATVATADKRSFLTIDGGATWIERKD
jgi:Putative zinc-finger